YLLRLPLERLQYVHLAGGTFKRGLYHDTHCHPLKQESLSLLAELVKLKLVPRVMLERDDSFPPEDEFNSELDAIKKVLSSAPEVLSEAAGTNAAEITAAQVDRAGEIKVELALAAVSNAGADSEESNPFENIGAGQLALMQALLIQAEPPAGFDQL